MGGEGEGLWRVYWMEKREEEERGGQRGGQGANPKAKLAAYDVRSDDRRVSTIQRAPGTKRTFSVPGLSYCARRQIADRCTRLAVGTGRAHM
eukprot:1326000-Rhodomonas_salina.1